MSTGNNIFN